VQYARRVLELEATQRPDEVPGADAGGSSGGLCLVRIWPTRAHLELPLSRQPVRLGRDPGSDVVCESPLASRRHAEVVRDGPIHLVRDLGSTNGVFLDGQRVTQGPLGEGTLLRFGDQLLMVARGPYGSIEEIAPGVIGGRLLRERFAGLQRAAPTDLPIVVEGDTGTGKEGAARAVHLWSGRQGRLVAVNCAAIPEQLAEAELFGHTRGAFTGASQSRPGCFRDADGGTLFLDEVLELPLALGAKLLRALEQGEVIPVGESRAVRVDVRLVVASQGSLEAAVAAQRFRADLFARLDGFTTRLPTLEERRGDIPALFESFVQQASAERPRQLDIALVERLALESWPRNVRQLRAAARRLVALYPDARTLTLTSWEEVAAASGAPQPASGAIRSDPETDLTRLLECLERAGGNLAQAARELGISRPRAYRILQGAGVDLERLRDASGQSPEEGAR